MGKVMDAPSEAVRVPVPATWYPDGHYVTADGNMHGAAFGLTFFRDQRVAIFTTYNGQTSKGVIYAEPGSELMDLLRAILGPIFPELRPDDHDVERVSMRVYYATHWVRDGE